ncbi:uncharacterized protein LOC128556909 [Mercenaria mercenaria]|uniref:uncharacterized protein LOC128556909 n=1 Tax=Mercenaria mercenaria TaxID=6596 RepID=UPI00234F87F0|nr:uncharacterized protein LOC128556909 [Mercenaria mercenaria]XP_053398804.1 uncharacterized protein LOC128556909 [Mercenaria mercenaria]XP_053398805.1 uncharacterized protein LOC128556909 [Mercenaria mercenaria]
MAEARTEEDGSLPVPDLPSYISNTSVDGASGADFISLSLQPQRIDIEIRQIQDIVGTNNVVLPQSNIENIQGLHQSRMQNIHGTIEMHEIPDHTQFYQNMDSSEDNFRIRLRTFRNWRVPFLDPEVLAEANFCFTGEGDTVRCTVCGGQLSNWQPGDNPRQEHLKEFGFACR